MKPQEFEKIVRAKTPVVESAPEPVVATTPAPVLEAMDLDSINQQYHALLGESSLHEFAPGENGGGTEAYTMEDEELDGMALGELQAIAQAAKKIFASVKQGVPLEAWMYKKITNGNEGLTAVAQQINNPAVREQPGVAEGAPIVVMPSHKRLEKKHKPSLSRGMDPAKAQGEQDARDGKPYNNPYPFKKELGAPGNWEHNSYKASYDSVKQGVAEGFPDDILAMAKKVSPNARIRGSRDEEIARRDAMLAQRARDHANAPEPKGVSDDERASLEAELQQLMPKYDKDYQMIDKYTQYMQAKHIADRVHEIQRKLKSGVAEGILAEDIMGLGDNEFEPKQHHDPEGNMARNELYRNAKYALDLLKMIEPDDEIEPWVAANLTNAATWLDKVYHYLDYRTKFEPEMDMKKDDKGIKESEAEPSGDIARMNLQEIMEYSIKLFKMIKPETRLDGWVAMKLTKASECVSSSKHYLEHQYFEKHSSDMYESKILKKFAKTLSKK